MRRPRVALFVTCLADQIYPEVGLATLRLLERLGCDVDFPEAQRCCGQPAFNSGYVAEARAVARSLLEAFEDAEYVVSPSGSCAGMIRQVDHVLRTRAEYLVGTDMGCLMNIAGRLERRGAKLGVLHLAQVLESGAREGVS